MYRVTCKLKLKRDTKYSQLSNHIAGTVVRITRMYKLIPEVELDLLR